MAVCTSVSLEFREFNYELDIQAQRELFLDAFPETKGTSQESLDHYHWKFRTYPSSPTAYEYVAVYEGKIVGYYAAIPYEYRLSSKKYKIAMVCDVMTHSCMRGKGIFTKLGAYALNEMSKKGLDFSFGYPIRPEVIPGHLKVGWEIAGLMPIYLKILKSDSIVKNKVASPIINILINIYNSIFSIFAKSNLNAVKIDFSEFSQSEEYAKFIDSLNGEDNSLIKSREFLEWRLSAPGVKYDAIVAYDKDKKVSGIAIVRSTILKGIPTLAILDIIIPADNKVVSSNLFRVLKEEATLRNLDVIALMVTKLKANKLGLIKHGYLKSPHVFKLIVKKLSYCKDKITAELFNPMWIDSDDL